MMPRFTMSDEQFKRGNRGGELTRGIKAALPLDYAEGKTDGIGVYLRKRFQ